MIWFLKGVINLKKNKATLFIVSRKLARCTEPFSYWLIPLSTLSYKLFYSRLLSWGVGTPPKWLTQLSGMGSPLRWCQFSLGETVRWGGSDSSCKPYPSAPGFKILHLESGLLWPREAEVPHLPGVPHLRVRPAENVVTAERKWLTCDLLMHGVSS